MNQIIIITNGNVKTLRGVTKIRFQADNDGDKYVEVYQGKKKIEELGVTVLDEKTLQIELEHPQVQFLQLLALRSFAPIREDAAEISIIIVSENVSVKNANTAYAAGERK